MQIHLKKDKDTITLQNEISEILKLISKLENEY